MMNHPSLSKALLFIWNHRFQRKKASYKQALGVMVDKTITIYLLLIGGYLFASLFIFSDLISNYHDQLMELEFIAKESIWLFLTILPLRAIFQSFKNPGVIYSSSEFQLSQLPYKRTKIWVLCVFKKWLKAISSSIIIGLLIILITPISSSTVLQYIFVFLFINVMMTIPQWRLYQAHFLIKSGWLLFMLLINFINLLANSPLFITVFVALGMMMNIYLIRVLFRDVHWERVNQISDFQIWNMRLISKASEVKFKQQKKYSIFQNTKRQKKPFQYNDRAIHHRLWKLYFGKNIELVVQMIGSMLVLLVVFRFVDSFLFYLALAVTIHIYTSVLAGFFKDRFTADILQVLPWDLQSYKKTFFKWVIYGGTILLVPIVGSFGLFASIWMPFQLFFYGSIFLYLYEIKMDKSIAMIEKRKDQFNFEEGAGVLFLIGVVWSGTYPVISIGTIPILWLWWRRK